MRRVRELGPRDERDIAAERSLSDLDAARAPVARDRGEAPRGQPLGFAAVLHAGHLGDVTRAVRGSGRLDGLFACIDDDPLSLFVRLRSRGEHVFFQ
jgi:hypothetical protein